MRIRMTHTPPHLIEGRKVRRGDEVDFPDDVAWRLINRRWALAVPVEQADLPPPPPADVGRVVARGVAPAPPGSLATPEPGWVYRGRHRRESE